MKHVTDWSGFACPKTQTYRSKKCCEWFRGLPCHICGGKARHHHETVTGRGIGIKGPDDEAVPLCDECHRRRHDMGRESFWEAYGENWKEVVSEYRKRWKDTPGKH